ncbi:ATP-binding protein [Candidatus Auribacterota bacterium]
MKEKVIWKLLSAFAFLTLVSIFVLNFFVSLKLQDYYERKITEELTSNALLISEIVKPDLLSGNTGRAEKKIADIAKRLDLRITLIDVEGSVTGDSEKPAGEMEDHSDRPEVIAAIKEGKGESTRYSDTVNYRMKYVAYASRDNGRLLSIIRLAVPLTDIKVQIMVIYRIVLLGGIAAVILVLIIGFFISRSLSRPINEMKEAAGRIATGDFSKKIEVRTKDELGDLARSLNIMADELRIKMEHLRKMDRVRTDFVANVSHELKTPLTTIKGFVETLEDGGLDDKENAKRFLDIIKKHAERLSNIINDLLCLTELELSRDRIERETFDMKDLAEEMLLGFGHALSVKKLDLKKEYKGKDFNVSADKSRMEQVFVNLIDNAVRYTEKNGTISVALEERPQDFLITIHDTGVGIPQEHLDRVFERFYRVDKARSRESGGTGLGLSIVKHIVTLHNGHIAIDSASGKGTVITVTLPKT